MNHEDSHTNTFHSPSDVTTLLKLKESTLRKYAYQLERAGWQFGKNSHGHRQYTDKDVTAIRRLITSKENTSMTLEQAAKELVSILKGENISVPVTNNEPEKDSYSDDIAELKELINRQTEVIKALSQHLHERDEYIKEKFKEQDEKLSNRDFMLMERLEMIEERKKEQEEAIKQIAAAKEELKEEVPNPKKKGFIARMFGRT